MCLKTTVLLLTWIFAQSNENAHINSYCNVLIVSPERQLCARIRWLLRGLRMSIEMSHARGPSFVKYTFCGHSPHVLAIVSMAGT